MPDPIVWEKTAKTHWISNSAWFIDKERGRYKLQRLIIKSGGLVEVAVVMIGKKISGVQAVADAIHEIGWQAFEERPYGDQIHFKNSAYFKPSPRMASRQRVRDADGRYAEMRTCERCRAFVGDDYYSDRRVDNGFGDTGICLCKACADAADAMEDAAAWEFLTTPPAKENKS